MSYYDFLASLLPQGPYDPSKQILKAILGSIGAQLDSRSSDGDSLQADTSPSTSDLNGIAIWEKVLGLSSDPSLSLQDRQQRCLAKSFRLPGVLTADKLVNILNAFSASSSAQVIEYPAAYQVCGILGIDDVSDYQQVLRAVASFLPAHLQFIMGFLISVKDQAKPVTSSLVSISRNVFANNGGPQSTGYFLDGTWALDGIEQLNNPGGAGPTVSSSSQIDIALSPVFGGGYQVTKSGYLLNGGPKLDGSWLLSGATIGTAVPASYQVSFNGSPVI